MARKPGYDLMILLTYTPRADSEARGYSDWLRRVDNPFFNAAEGVAHYSNWRIVGAPNPQMGTYFDFLGIESMDSLQTVFYGRELNEFRKEWRRLWGIDPNGEPGVNAQAYLCERAAKTPKPQWGTHVVILPAQQTDQRLDGFDTWRVREALRQTDLSFPEFHVRFAGNPEACTELQKLHADRSVVVGDLVAAP